VAGASLNISWSAISLSISEQVQGDNVIGVNTMAIFIDSEVYCENSAKDSAGNVLQIPQQSTARQPSVLKLLKLILRINIACQGIAVS
jgi:hypothetical protein